MTQVYLSGGAMTAFGRHTGTLAPGMRADLVVLSGDPVPAPGRPASTVEATCIGGRFAHVGPTLADRLPDPASPR